MDDYTTYKEDPEFKKYLSSINISEKELLSKSKVQMKLPKDLTNKVTKINTIAQEYRMILEGKQYFEEEGSFIQVSKAIAGSKFINLSYGVISSYSNEANLITKKNMDHFIIQLKDAFEKVNNLILRDRTISEKDSRLIIKLFKDKLFNIGEIITGSSGNMDKIFSNTSEEIKDDFAKTGLF